MKTNMLFIRKNALIIVGVFICIGYYQYTKMASVVSSKVSSKTAPAAYRAAAALSTFGKQ